MSFNFGLCSVSFRKNTPKEILQAMKAAELSFIEWGSDVHCPPESAREIAELQKQFGIKCCSYGTYFRVGVTPIEELNKYINAAKVLETKVLRLWCGDKNSEDYSEEQKEFLFGECKAVSKIAETENVTLCMECHNNTYTNRKESALELMRVVNSTNFKMYWQPNQFKIERENVQYAEMLSPYTENIHVFNWKGKEKYPLADARDTWKRYLSFFENNKNLLLEFMPDGRLETLKAEAESLKGLVR